MAGSAPAPGSPGYWVQLIEYLYAADPWDFDRDLFGAVLLCLVAQTGGLIVDVSDKRDVRDAVSSVHAILDRLFGVHPKLIHLKPHTPPSTIWREEDDNAEAVIITGLNTASHLARLRVVDVLRENESRERFTLAVWVRARNDPPVPPWVLDMFTVSCVSRGLLFDLPSERPARPPLSLDYVSSLHEQSLVIHIHPPLSLHISNLLSATSHHPRLRTHLTARAQLAFPALIKAHRVLEGSAPAPYATADNADAIYLMLVRHRVSLRAKRQEILWLLQGSAADALDHGHDDPKHERRKTDTILAGILSTV